MKTCKHHSHPATEGKAKKGGLAASLAAPLISPGLLVMALSAQPLVAHADDNASIVTNPASANDTALYAGAGLGAAGGALVAGPLGMLAGGLLGAWIGDTQGADAENVIASEHNTREHNTPEQVTAERAAPHRAATAAARSVTPAEAVTARDENSGAEENRQSVVASLQALSLHAGEKRSAKPSTQTPRAEKAQNTGTVIASLDTPTSPARNNDLLTALTGGFSLDVYFRTRSEQIESFYPQRLRAVAALLKRMPQLDVRLEGYSDRRGDRQANAELAAKRIDSVRRQLLDAGVDAGRIHSTALGETHSVSTPGDLEGYVFDRKVVIRFQASSAMARQAASPMAVTALADK